MGDEDERFEEIGEDRNDDCDVDMWRDVERLESQRNQEKLGIDCGSDVVNDAGPTEMV
jgi:hypothetical protein